MSYQHLLVAVDAALDREPLLAKAQQLAKLFSARLSVVSVVVPMPVNTFSADPGMGMTLPIAMEPAFSEDTREELRRSLCAACTPLGVDDADIHLVLGNADSAILETAKALGVDLIVMGHHQHQGFLSRLFSHTDESVVGKAKCDVLAVLLPSTTS